ncbi:MAG: TolC family protein, partial [Deltaproteobacteria bacterium]
MFKYATLILALLLCLPLPADVRAAEELLSWTQCVQEAQKNHPDLISAEASVKQSQADKKIVASDLLPQVASTVSAATAMTTSSSSGTKTRTTTDTYSYGATGTQLLFDGGKTVNNVKAAAQDVEAARYNYRFTSTEVRLRLRTAFIALLKAQELLKITQEIHDIRRNNLVLIDLRYESGLEHRGALMTAEANLAQAQFEIGRAQRALEVVQTQLVKEMGREGLSDVRAEGDFTVSDAFLEKPDFQALAKDNPSLEKRIAQKNAASFGIKSAQANFLPELSAQAGVGRKNASWPPENDQWNAGVTLSLPIFEGGLRLAQVDKARAAYDQARADERSTKDGVLVALEQTWAALQDAVAYEK